MVRRFLESFYRGMTWPIRRARWLSQARPIRFTQFGWYFIFFSLATGAAAINTGNNLLYLMLGLLLGFIIISGFLSDSCLWGLEVEFRPKGDFYAGQPAEWDLVARKNWFPGIIVRLEAIWQDRTTRHLFYWIPRYGQQTLPLSLTPHRRGAFQLKTLRFSSCFPFGLFEKSHQRSRMESWVVFPPVKVFPLNALRAAGLATSDQPVDRKGPGVTPFDLRTYQSGDSSKRIHWKSSAKRGRLMVAEMEDESAASQRLRVTRWPTGSDGEAFIAFLASLVYTLALYERPISLYAPGITFEPARSRTQLKRILNYLALLDPEKEAIRTSSQSTVFSNEINVVSVWETTGRHHV